MKRVFVDTGWFVAVLVAEDAHHLRAMELLERAESEGWSLVTTNAVVVETYSMLLSRARDSRRAVLAFLDVLAEDTARDLTVERVRVNDEDRAKALVRSHEDKDYSLCDALSFVVMERLRIAEAIAFDRHFREYGRFIILR